MFEKDLYALIRGLRNHKGNEKGYIQDSIKECRREIRGQDMDHKATALLKLIYLEMFGYDMSWASFHVLEVMSSAKYLHKRVGYLAAIQSFRPDTEVLMLGENLLKKDLASMQHVIVSLALATIPHIINVSMANSLLIDLLPRLTHSHPVIRKKTVVTLYRLALVYPETLRVAWPKIKERLLDEQENTSVTAAVVNVICELGWRRPHDFLPLAPRLFELLVAGGNNWMAIKIIKLFAVLTPLEPRLIRKLLSPLTNLIRTTPAMSLLYECINGIISGGILDGSEGTVEGDEIARLCVGKLRGMLVVVGDPNLKYVALLALTKIVHSHPQLVSDHSDVILECIDDPDVSIRSRVLDLVSGMVNANNLMAIVEQLLAQLRDSRSSTNVEDRTPHEVVPSSESDDEDASESLRHESAKPSAPPPLPDDYRALVIYKILHLCGKEMYANITDFEWYVGVLVELVRHSPPDDTVADVIGDELVNIAVRVKSIRSETAAAAQSLILVEKRRDMFGPGSQKHVLGAAAWVVGEYAQLTPDPDAVLTSLTHPANLQLDPTVLSLVVQAIPKVFVSLTSQHSIWTPARKSQVVLLAARVVHFLESLYLHPTLQVQERAVEYLELMRLASEAASTHQTGADGQAPLLLTHAIPLLFRGAELNPMAPGALRKVPVADELDLDVPLNASLQTLLSQAEIGTSDEKDAAWKFYTEQPVVALPRPASGTLDIPASKPVADVRSKESLARLKAQRREQYRNDPFYIEPRDEVRSSSPLHQILQSSNGEQLDVDSIPVMNLEFEQTERRYNSPVKKPRKSKVKVDIMADETIDGEESDERILPKTTVQPVPVTSKKALLQVDSSAISRLSLNEEGLAVDTLDVEKRQQEEDEMRRAILEVERRRLEMQRDSERVAGPEEVVVVKRKKKTKKVDVDADGDAQGSTKEKKKSKKDKKHKTKVKRDKSENTRDEGGDLDGTAVEGPAVGESAGAEATVVPKRKKKRQVTFDEV